LWGLARIGHDRLGLVRRGANLSPKQDGDAKGWVKPRRSLSALLPTHNCKLDQGFSRESPGDVFLAPAPDMFVALIGEALQGEKW
jgi:hypothetical protein